LSKDKLTDAVEQTRLT